MRYCAATALVLAIMIGFLPLAHTAPSPGIPALYFESLGGPYFPGQTTQVQFKVQNKAVDTITNLSLDVKASSGWSVSSGTIHIGDLAGSAQKTFSIQLQVGSLGFSAVGFTAKSNDHITLTFPVSILVVARVKAEDIARLIGQSANPLLDIATQWGTYTISRIGEILFPSTATGITDETGFPQILQGYFVKNYLNNHGDLGSQLSSLVNQVATLASDTNSMQSGVNHVYSFSISLAGNTVTYYFSVYQFLTWQIPFSQWTLGLVQDKGVADLIAWGSQQLGLSVSTNDIITLADFLLRGGIGSLGSYTNDVQSLAQLLSKLVNTNVPDLNSLIQALSTAGRVLSHVGDVISSLTSLINGVLGRIAGWVKNLAQQLYQVFQQLLKWISAHTPVFADQVNGAIVWLYNQLSQLLNNVIDLFNQGSQAKSTAQSAQSGLSAMSAEAQQSSNAIENLATRLSQAASQTKRAFDGFCGQYQPALGKIESISTWLGRAATYVSLFTAATATPVVQLAFGGVIVLENTIDIGCSISLTGQADPVKLISLANGATLMLGDMFPREENEFHAIGAILGGIAAALPVARQLLSAMDAHAFDVGQLSNIVASYESASSQGSTAYNQGTPNYIDAIGAIASIANYPLVEAMNSVLQNIEPCSNAITELRSYTEQGMVAPDLQTQAQACQQKGQSAISAIVNADYSAVSLAAALPDLASNLSSATQSRYQQFLQARDLVGKLETSVRTLSGCGFLWVQPDPSQVLQANQAVQQAQSQFNSGQYADSIETANSNLKQISSASQTCDTASTQAKLEVGVAVGVVAVVSIIVVGLAIHRARGPRTKEEENLEEPKQSVEATPALSLSPAAEQNGKMCPKCGSEVTADARFCTNCGATLEPAILPPPSTPSGYLRPSLPEEAPPTLPLTPLEMQAVAAEQRPEPKVQITTIESLKPDTSKPPEPEAQVIPTKTSVTKATKPRTRKPAIARTKTRRARTRTRSARARRKTGRKVQASWRNDGKS